MPDPAAAATTQADDDLDLSVSDDDAVTDAPASVAASPDAVKNSPEYRALRTKARREARERGRIERELADLRTAQAAAEADRIADQERQVREVLGDAGVDRWNQIAELSSSDPVAAARAMRDFAAEMAQSQPPAGAQGAGTTTPQGGQPVPPITGTPPPPPDRGVSAGVPLGAQGNDNSWAAIKADAERRFGELVERNQNPATRNRVTMRDRAEGIITYVAGAVAGAMEERAARTR